MVNTPDQSGICPASGFKLVSSTHVLSMPDVNLFSPSQLSTPNFSLSTFGNEKMRIDQTNQATKESKILSKVGGI